MATEVKPIRSHTAAFSDYSGESAAPVGANTGRIP
jgi:hypothetical protein